MPHLIIEFARDLADDTQVSALLEAVHQAAAASGLFQLSHIRSRAIPLSFYRAGEDNAGFIHAQLRIHAGRDAAQKQALSSAVLAAIRGQGWPVRSITVEVVEMDRASYSKYSV